MVESRLAKGNARDQIQSVAKKLENDETKVDDCFLTKVDASLCPREVTDKVLREFEGAEVLNFELEARKQRIIIQRMAEKSTKEMDELNNQLEVSRSKNSRLVEETKTNFQTYMKVNRLSEKDTSKVTVLQELAKRKAIQLDTIARLKDTLAQLEAMDRSIDQGHS